MSSVKNSMFILLTSEDKDDEEWYKSCTTQTNCNCETQRLRIHNNFT